MLDQESERREGQGMTLQSTLSSMVSSSLSQLLIHGLEEDENDKDSTTKCKPLKRIEECADRIIIKAWWNRGRILIWFSFCFPKFPFLSLFSCHLSNIWHLLSIKLLCLSKSGFEATAISYSHVQPKLNFPLHWAGFLL